MTLVLSCISDNLVFGLSVNGLVMPNNLLKIITAAKRFGVKCLELDLFLVLYIMSIFFLCL